MRTLRVRASAIASASVSPALLTRHQAPQGVVPLAFVHFAKTSPPISVSDRPRELRGRTYIGVARLLATLSNQILEWRPCALVLRVVWRRELRLQPARRSSISTGFGPSAAPESEESENSGPGNVQQPRGCFFDRSDGRALEVLSANISRYGSRTVKNPGSYAHEQGCRVNIRRP